MCVSEYVRIITDVSQYAYIYIHMKTNLWGFLRPPVTGADFLADFVASCFLGALPPVDLRAVCFVRAILLFELNIKARFYLYIYILYAVQLLMKVNLRKYVKLNNTLAVTRRIYASLEFPPYHSN